MGSALLVSHITVGCEWMRECKSVGPQYMREFWVKSYKLVAVVIFASQQESSCTYFFFLPGGVDNCVKLLNARSICNPDDADDEGTDPK